MEDKRVDKKKGSSVWDRPIRSLHDVLIVVGAGSSLLFILVMCGYAKGVISWYDSEESFGFNVVGADYIVNQPAKYKAAKYSE